jgi:hypothetical protein
VQNGVFVDDSCKEYIFSGYNAWQVRMGLPAWWPCSQSAAPARCLACILRMRNLRGSWASCCGGFFAQTLEMAANMCCGNQAALTSQFQEAGAEYRKACACCLGTRRLQGLLHCWGPASREHMPSCCGSWVHHR